MFTFMGAQVLAFALGVLSCIVSWYWLLRVKPDIRVANLAAFNPRTQRLGIKVINFSRRQATSVQVQAAVATKPNVGVDTTRVVGKLRWETVLALDPIQNINGFWTLPTTFVFICENGAEMIQELERPRDVGVDSRVVFTISARDALSGTVVVKRTSYRRDQVLPGWYRPRLSFALEPTLATSEPVLGESSDLTSV